MDKEKCNLYLLGKPESGKYTSKRGGPSINDRCVYRLLDEFEKKGIEVDLNCSEASYVDPVSRFNSEKKSGKCCIADEKDLKEKYVFLNYFLKAKEFEMFLEDIFEDGVEGIHCHLNFRGEDELKKRRVFNDIKEVLGMFYGFDCRDTK